MAIKGGKEVAYLVDKGKKGTAKKGKTLRFDGVYKLSTTASVTIDDEKGTGSGYTNKAKNAPTEISMECAISELYVSESDNALTKGADTRNKPRVKKALKYLLDMKKERRLVEIHTTYITYKSMLLKSIEVEQSPDTQYQIHMNLTFHEYIKKDSKKNSSTSETPQSEDDTHTPSNLSNFIYNA